MPRSSFPSTSDDEYYLGRSDRPVGFNREGVALGQVRELMSTGPQTVLVLAYEQDGKAQERMIPFVSGLLWTRWIWLIQRITDWQPGLY